MTDQAFWASLLLSTGTGMMQLPFMLRVLRRPLRLLIVLWYAAAYAVLLFVQLPPPAAAFLLIPDGLLLYAAARSAGAAPVPSFAAATLSLCLSQSVNGIGASVLTLALASLIAKSTYNVLYWCVILGMLALFAGAAYVTLRLLPNGTEERTAAGIVLVPLLFFLAAEVFLIETMPAVAQMPVAPEETSRHSILLVLQILELAAILCTAAAAGRIEQSIRQKSDLAALAQAARHQEQYVAEARQRYERTRSVRHDIRNHLSVLSGLIDHEQYDDARAYLSDLLEETKRFSLPVYTGRPAVDILLAEKIQAAEEQGIKVSVAAPLPECASLADVDLCVLFGNAMDNAAAAACAAGNNARIAVQSSRQGAFLLITFENSVQPGSAVRPGIGLANIRAVAQKNAGAMDYHLSGDAFTLRVLLELHEE